MSKAANQILKTAEHLFNLHSFGSVGVDLIRDHSGSSKTTMYTHFKNKQQLISAVLQQRHERFQSQLSAFVDTEINQPALLKILDWHFTWFQQEDFKGCMFVRIVAETELNAIEFQTIAQQHKQWIYQFIYSKCEQMHNPTQLTEFFYTQLEGLISRFMVEGFNKKIANQQKQLILKLINSLQDSTE